MEGRLTAGRRRCGLRSGRAERIVGGFVVVHGVYAAARSRRSPSLAGRPLGLRWPGGAASEALLWGSAVAPPFVLLGAFGFAAARARRDWLGLLGLAAVVGQLSEPIVYQRRTAPAERWVTPTIAGNLAAGSVLFARWRMTAPVRGAGGGGRTCTPART